MPYKDPDQNKDYQRRWYRQNAAKVQARTVTWQKQNPGRRSRNPIKAKVSAAKHYRENTQVYIERSSVAQSAAQDATRPKAKLHGQPWDTADDLWLLQFKGPVTDAALHLGRTYYAVKARRVHLKSEPDHG